MNWWSQCSNRLLETRRQQRLLSHQGASESEAMVWFCSPLRLTTPLRALHVHGEVAASHALRFAVSEGPLTGYWRPATAGASGSSPCGLVSSSIGLVPWHGGELLPLLIAIREIVELDISIDQRIILLTAQMACNRLNAISQLPTFALPKLVELFFPSFLRQVPNLPAETISAMQKLGLDTPAAIIGADPKTLLALKGIGPATLATLIKASRRAAARQQGARIDTVLR